MADADGVSAQAAAVAEGIDLERWSGCGRRSSSRCASRAPSCCSQILSAARPVAIDVEDAVLEVGFPASAAFNKRKAEASRRARPVRRRAAHDRRRARCARCTCCSTATRSSREAEQKLSEDELIELMRTEFDAEEYLPEPESGEAEAKEAEG